MVMVLLSKLGSVLTIAHDIVALVMMRFSNLYLPKRAILRDIVLVYLLRKLLPSNILLMAFCSKMTHDADISYSRKLQMY